MLTDDTDIVKFRMFCTSMKSAPPDWAVFAVNADVLKVNDELSQTKVVGSVGLVSGAVMATAPPKIAVFAEKLQPSTRMVLWDSAPCEQEE